MRDRQHVAAVVLAAGESRRFGGRKQLAQLAGRTLLEHVLELARSAGLDPVVAVVPVWLTRPASMDDPALRWVRNAYPGRGMSHSLRLGFAALPDVTQAAVILLGDQPTVPVATVAALIAARGQKPLVATRAEGRLATPVLVERSHFQIVDGPVGDIGLREVLDAHPDWVLAVDVEEHAPDVDTAANLDAMLGATRARRGDRGG
jgi:molybdenum cofactor cytidylyltransferase